MQGGTIRGAVFHDPHHIQPKPQAQGLREGASSDNAPCMDTKSQRDPAGQLAEYRAQIDAIDTELVRLLIARSGIVTHVKHLKDAHWPSACHIRPGREGQMHADMFARFKGSPLGAQAGAEFWRLIISASTMIESPLKIVSMPATATLAQCYFSPLAQYEEATTTPRLIDALTHGRAEIACIPYEDHATIANIMAALPTLRIFAYAPLVLKAGNAPQALFIGNVTPEASGDDISYFLRGETLLRLPGYHETHPSHADAIFIGAHATPLHAE